MSAHRWFRPTLRRNLISGLVPCWVLRHPRKRYVVAAVLSTPEWVDRDALKALADLRDQLADATGVEHVLDHIVPLNHSYVCGLNVPWNIQVIPKARNAIKSNAWCEWQGDLFVQSEMLQVMP